MKKVIIIGGGIGGLCAAIALQRSGVEAHVYEKVPKIKALGAGMAIEDAAVLARLLSERGSVDLKEYEQLRMKRTQNIVRKFYQLGSLAQWENPWLRSVRNATLRLIPPSLQEKQMRQLYEVNL